MCSHSLRHTKNKTNTVSFSSRNNERHKATDVKKTVVWIDSQKKKAGSVHWLARVTVSTYRNNVVDDLFCLDQTCFVAVSWHVARRQSYPRIIYTWSLLVLGPSETILRPMDVDF